MVSSVELMIMTIDDDDYDDDDDDCYGDEDNDDDDFDGDVQFFFQFFSFLISHFLWPELRTLSNVRNCSNEINREVCMCACVCFRYLSSALPL